MPKYGSDAANGFFLREGGYYWAASDNFDLKVTGTVYTNGTFGVNAATKYRVNYKYSGNLSFAYIRQRPADPDLPGAKSTNDFKVAWSFQLDPKAAPSNTFNASVNVSTANFNQANRESSNALYQTALNSNINYSKSFPRIPFLSFTIGASHSQNLQTRSFYVNFPTIGLNLSRVTPFKAKISTGTPKWYENIGISYQFQAKNTLNTYDTLLSLPNIAKNLRYGISQNINLDAQVKLFKYFNLVPNIQYTERWYFQTINETWINKDQIITLPGGYQIINKGLASYVQTDTIYGFKAARDFNTNISFNTKVTGIYNFKGKYIKALRHVLTPSISANYRPDFGTNFWGYYGSVRRNIYDQNPQPYSHFALVNGVYGEPPRGTSAALNWSLNNNFEMKIYSKKDTVNHERKIGILERFNISGGYDFARDSLKLLPFNISGSMKLWDNINAVFGIGMDPYGLGANGAPINKFYWSTNHQLLRFTNANLSINAVFHGKPKANTTPTPQKTSMMRKEYVSYNPDDFYDFDIPWNVSAYYTLDLRSSFQTFTQRDSLILSQQITANADFNLTPKWKIAVSSGYNFTQKDFTITRMRVVRSLHCWELSFDWTAYPVAYQQFQIELKILNPMLQDLKLTKKSDQYGYR
jgi:hypothetical protein